MPPAQKLYTSSIEAADLLRAVKFYITIYRELNAESRRSAKHAVLHSLWVLIVYWVRKIAYKSPNVRLDN